MSSKAEARRRTQAQRAKRSNQLLIVGAVAVIAVIAVVVLVVLSNRPRSTTSTDYAGLPQSVEEAPGLGIRIGAEDAPVVVTEYSDYSCPHCYDLSPAIDQVIATYVAQGKVALVYKPISFVNPPTSVPAAAAMVCAAQQGKGFEMHDEVWDLYTRGGPNAYTRALLTARANNIGLDVSAFEQCFDSSETVSALQGVLADAQQAGVAGTPTVFVNGQIVTFSAAGDRFQELSAAIEEALAEAGS